MMNQYLVASQNDNFLCQADDYSHAVEQFKDAYGHDDVNVSLVLPMTAIDNAVLDQTPGTPDIQWNSKLLDRLWLGVGNLSVYIRHNDEGVSVDLYGDVNEDSLGSTYVFFSEAEDEA